MLDGKVTYEAVAEAHGLEFTPLDGALLAGQLAVAPRRARLRAASSSCASPGVGLSLTTSQVTPAASAIDARR